MSFVMDNAREDREECERLREEALTLLRAYMRHRAERATYGVVVDLTTHYLGRIERRCIDKSEARQWLEGNGLR